MTPKSGRDAGFARKERSMRREEKKEYLLSQNENEAKSWIAFLEKHMDKEVLKSLEQEIANRFVFKFDVAIRNSESDKKRTALMKRYLLKSDQYLK